MIIEKLHIEQSVLEQLGGPGIVQWYEVGHIYGWSRPPVNNPTGETTLFSKCLGFIQIGDFQCAVLRLECPRGQYIKNFEQLIPLELFQIEPILNTNTGKYIPTDMHPPIYSPRPKLTIKITQDNNFYIDTYNTPSVFADTDLDFLLESLNPYLIEELTNNPSLLSSQVVH